MKLYNTKKGLLLEDGEKFYQIREDWDSLVNREDLHGYLSRHISTNDSFGLQKANEQIRDILAPIGSQEVWAAGVTYLRSREARMEESKDSGGATFYDKVYEADRPELFFKSLAHRVSGHGQDVYIRRDSSWNVPEPELALFINSKGKIAGYAVANDMSSRSIEGENPLYLPQAKMYEKSAALGPGLYIPAQAIHPEALIHMTITRNAEIVFQDSVSISRMKRKHEELASWLFREMDFHQGVYLMTGTCLVPANDFTLHESDKVDISIEGIGTLSNRVMFRAI